MILVPGSLIILKQKIPGYNNILTMANYSMSFGLNGDVNKTPKPERKKEKDQEDEVLTPKAKQSNIKINNDIGGSSLPVFSAINHSGIKSFSGENISRSIPKNDTRSDVERREHEDLVEVYGTSAVVGFIALKIFTTVF